MSINFYNKLIETYDMNLVGDNWIHSTIAWCTDHRYRKYTKLNSWLNKQVIGAPDELYDLAQDLSEGRQTDKTVVNIVSWVQKNVRYVSDKYENWKGAHQTLLDKFGDCDDMNCLVYVLCRLARVHQFTLFCAIGDMTVGGHFFPLYYSTKCMKIVTLDTTYYANTISVANREDFNDLDYHESIWYLFNEDIVIKPLN